MILAGLVLLTIGGVDLVRAFATRRWVGYVVVGIVIGALATIAIAPMQALVAVVAAGLWMWLVPTRGRARASFWPVIGLALLCAVAVTTIVPRESNGLIAQDWALRTPFGELSADALLLVAGVLVFLSESANVVVRLSLNAETYDPASQTKDLNDFDELEGIDELADEAFPAQAQPLQDQPALKGGRLIGPLERVLIFALTLISAYTLVAAFVAAKGIVRFPEISRDSGRGNSAEYFLVGSMISWVLALGGAFLVWWPLALV